MKGQVMLLYILHLGEKQQIFCILRLLTFTSASSESVMNFLYQCITKNHPNKQKMHYILLFTLVDNMFILTFI